jgi:hypothetical protein
VLTIVQDGGRDSYTGTAALFGDVTREEGRAGGVAGAVIIGLLAELISKEDQENLSPDQVVIRVVGEKFWPKNEKYKDMKRGQIQYPNVRIEDWDISQRIVVYDYDVGSNDDELIQLTNQGCLDPRRAKSEFGFGLIKKGDTAAYEFEFELITEPSKIYTQAIKGDWV